MKHTIKFALTISVGVIALCLAFLLHEPLWAQILVSLAGSLVALSMFIEMIKTLKSGQYGVDLLAITAIIATLAVGEYWAALMVLVMLTGGDSLEDYAAHKAGRELKTLLDNSPQTAHRLVNDAVEDVSVDKLQVGDQVIIKPGELVPVDGHIIAGSALFDESSLTGESRPVEKALNNELMSGSVNGDTSVTMQVDQLAVNSQYQAIVRLVETSAAQPAHFVRLADRYAVPFTLVAYVIAGVAWWLSKDPVRFAEVLVVASPCPLILAAPIALISGMSRASRNGIIVKAGTTIEKLASAKSAAFDKTGTITNGQLTVDQVVPVIGIAPTDLLQLAASAEQESSHILARSLVKAAQVEQLQPIETLKEATGAGVVATLSSGQTVRVGKHQFVTPDAQQPLQEQTTVYVAINDQYAGYITFIDHLRPEAPATMQTLHQLGITRLMMLTGDQATTAHQIAEQVGIDDVHAGCLPVDKIHLIEQVPQDQRPLIMVGDGVNDAPSLASADVGIAMGAHGATAASESADVVILKDDLGRVSRAVQIARDTMRVARQAVLIGIAICIGLMLIASTGIVPALVGALFQEVVDTVSILYALRARTDR
ncbi:cadmium-translocating P-type ATPase [Latilactobacillus curvatus]|uniref:heavy metal translocating P-type ATPase n=1 Tax=Latilactobacillus curvatus TaxID=28038 RepID=UPI0020C7D3CA|nr:heavy metal translocating P-type ATPase [Latilactobacillus curvatus]MCP8848225.1 cadmium-translocating P-type ATPase [Latilactobacillus curvatus]MCP8864198.1 cadmium-translocating P-type ATPase [Latilactobacillus curvatus]MCP8873051.1 cadmium-translocating P-type ATPase [Latilactobacillus curvatus]MCP8874844.1 cadmium-translocating P-type ATPase [Latilactobacillus curvatus]MCP8878454.1 cadmium-translocating P-type ATPase [Latilactobacillus curvatus]